MLRGNSGDESSSKKGKKRRIAFFAVYLASALLLTAVTLLAIAGFQALAIKKDLTSLLSLSSTFSASISDKNTQKLDVELQEASVITSEALSITHSFPWQFSQALPLIGENFRAIDAVLQSTDSLINKVALPSLPLIDETLSGQGLLVDGGINTSFLNDTWEILVAAQGELKSSDQLLATIDMTRLLPEVRSGFEKIAPFIHTASQTAELAGSYKDTVNSLVGMTGPRNYLVVFQNPAEMRPLGGLPGSIALMKVDNGSFSIERQTSASMSIYPFQDSSEFALESTTHEELFYEDANRQMAQAMNTSSFSQAAQRVVGHWSRAFPEPISGVISVDPIALGYLLSSFGPIELDSGAVLNESNLSQYLLHDVYEITDSNIEQDLLYEEVVDKFVNKFKQGPVDPLKLLGAFQKGTSESRLLLWSPTKSENDLAQKLNMSVETPISTSSTTDLALYFEFAQGSKMYYFLNQSVSVTSNFCASTKIQTIHANYELVNTVRPEEAESIAPSIWAVSHVKPKGSILSRVLLYSQPGATIDKVTHTEGSIAVREYIDGKNPVSFTETLLAPSTSASVDVTYSFQSELEKTVILYTTPLAQPTKTKISYTQKCD